MTAAEGQELFNQVVLLILSAWVIGAGIGLAIGVFKEALK